MLRGRQKDPGQLPEGADLAGLFFSTIREGLENTTILRCSDWSEKHRVMGKPFPGKFSFEHHPWCREMHDLQCRRAAGMKAAQMGFTETAINRTLYSLVVERTDVLYILPATRPDAHDFSSSRFDKALQLSPTLSGFFTSTSNVGHKRAEDVNLYVRGSNATSGLKSTPVGRLMLDELDEMVQKQVRLVFDRLSGHEESETFVLAISTPTIPEAGIDGLYQKSDRRRFFFRCPHCSKWIDLEWPRNLIEPGRLVCHKCLKTLDHKNKIEYFKDARWVPSKRGTEWTGWHISQLYSMTVSPQALWKTYSEAVLSGSTSDMQLFHNGQLGLPFLEKDARLDPILIRECLGSYETASRSAGSTMGVDVGRWLHYQIDEWPDGNKIKRTIKVGKAKDFTEIATLLDQYHVRCCVVDANPETREAKRFQEAHRQQVWLAGYSTRKMEDEWLVRRDLHFVKLSRTEWMDRNAGRFRRGLAATSLPLDVATEYKLQLMAPARIYVKEKSTGAELARYVEGSRADHYFHAGVYSEVAMRLMGKGTPPAIPDKMDEDVSGEDLVDEDIGDLMDGEGPEARDVDPAEVARNALAAITGSKPIEDAN